MVETSAALPSLTYMRIDQEPPANIYYAALPNGQSGPKKRDRNLELLIIPLAYIGAWAVVYTTLNVPTPYSTPSRKTSSRGVHLVTISFFVVCIIWMLLKQVPSIVWLGLVSVVALTFAFLNSKR